MIEPIKQVIGTGVPIQGADIDTDRIIPARFMKCVTFDGLGEYAFYDVRYDNDGNITNHILNDAAYQKAEILVAGINFGCGSSREHAPQALVKYGFKAVIAESFAEIFFGNSTTLGFPCVIGAKADVDAIKAALEADSTLEVKIDIENLTVSYADVSFAVTMPASAVEALTSGKYDPINELLAAEEAVESTLNAQAYLA